MVDTRLMLKWIIVQAQLARISCDDCVPPELIAILGVGLGYLSECRGMISWQARGASLMSVDASWLPEVFLFVRLHDFCLVPKSSLNGSRAL